MSLVELIERHSLTPDRVLTVEREMPTVPGFLVTIAHLTQEARARMLKQAEETTFVKHQPVRTVNEEKLAALLAHQVLGWRGLSMRKLCRMLWLDISALCPEQKDQEIAFSPEDAQGLMFKHSEFAAFVLRAAMDVDNFAEALEGAEKNSSSGCASGPNPGEPTVAAA